jgi:hypothetical protein
VEAVAWLENLDRERHEEVVKEEVDGKFQDWFVRRIVDW